MAQAPVNQSFSEPPPPYTEAAGPDKNAAGSAPPPPGFVVGPGQGPPPAAATYTAGAPVYPPPQQQRYPAPQTTTVITTQPAQTVTVVRLGNCPRCQQGMLVEDFSCLGICLAIFCFPIGVLCCLILRDRRCNRCGYTV